MKLFLDSAVFLILSAPGPERDRWCDWIAERLQSGGRLFTSVHALLETDQQLHDAGMDVNNRREFLQDLDDLLESSAPLYSDDLQRLIDLGAAHELDQAAALHATLAFNNEMDAVVSPRTDFDRVPGISRLSPDQD